MASIQIPLLFLLLVNVYSQDTLSILLEEPRGKIIPRPESVYVGDELQLICVLENNEFTASNLTFTASNLTFTASNLTFTVFYPIETTGDTRKCINQQDINVINKTTAVLSVQNISRAGRAEYSCYTGSAVCFNLTETTNDGWIDSVDVPVLYRPQNITNFFCVVCNFNESMNCTWQHPVLYEENFNDMYVSFVYSSGEQSSSFSPCPKLNYNGCFWDGLNGSDRYIIQVNVTNNKTKDVASQIFIVQPSQQVKPSPVTDLLITNTTNKNMFLLSWKGKGHWPLIFQVYIKLPVDKDYKMIANNITDQSLTYELRPNTMHMFFVQSFPGLNYSGYWSDKTFYSYHTPEQPPSFGPETTNGSYNDLSESCVNDYDRRQVMVFWKDVIESARNGVITNYAVKLEGKVLTVVSSESHSATVEVSCHKPHIDLGIAAVNSAGESTIPSVIRLAPFNFKVPWEVKESFAIELNGTNAKASWNVRTVNMNNSFVVFWCIEDAESSCKGPINWSHVPGTQSHLDIAELPTKVMDYRFGLAMRYDDSVSGIHWTDCLFNPQPSSLPAPIILDIQPDTESAIVVWQKILCTKKSQILVTGYRVVWCQQEECNDSSNIQTADVAASLSSFKVSRLKANTIYKVAVLGKVHDQLGQELLWKEVIPKPTESNITLILVITFTVLMLILCVLIILFYRKCMDSRRRARNLLPEVQNYDNVSPQKEDIILTSLYQVIQENPPVPINQTINRSPSDSSFSDSPERVSDSNCHLIRIPKKLKGSKSHDSVPLHPMSPKFIIPSTPEVNTGKGMQGVQEITHRDENGINVSQGEKLPISVGPNERKPSHLNGIQEYVAIGQGDSMCDLIPTDPAVVGENSGLLLLSQIDSTLPDVGIKSGDDNTSPSVVSGLSPVMSQTSLNQSMAKFSQESLQSFPDDLNDIVVLTSHCTSELNIRKRLADITENTTDQPAIVSIHLGYV